MSGGHFEYNEEHLRTLSKQISGHGSYRGVDPEKVNWDIETISEFLYDLFELFHAYDYWVSGDTREEKYRKAEQEFISKWDMPLIPQN